MKTTAKQCSAQLVSSFQMRGRGVFRYTLFSSDSTTDTYDGVVIGNEEQAVGTSTVDTLHVRVTITDDKPSDSQIVDTWFLTGTDLVVSQTSTVATSNASQVGTVRYAETYEIHLTSLTPSR